MGAEEKKVIESIITKPYLSPSQISMYTRCGEQYRRRYLKKEIIPPGVSLIKGTSVHKASETNFKQKIKSHKDLPKKDIIDISVATLENTIKNEGVLLNKDEETIGKEKVICKAKDSVAIFGALYSAQVAPRYQPKEVEKEQFIIIEKAPFDLKGKLDLVDDHERIIDLKTGTKSKNQADIDSDGQLTFYSMMYRALYRCEPTDLIIEQVIDKSVPENKTFHTKRDINDYKAMINRINVIADAINKGVFTPANLDSWWCSDRFCGFFDTCPYRSKKEFVKK